MEVRRTHHSIPWISRAVEVCLGLALFVPPFIFGARQAYGQLALAVFVLLAFGFWMLGKIVRWQVSIPLARPEVLLPLAALGLTIITWVSLPPALIQKLSPGIARLLPEWNKSVVSGQWLVASQEAGKRSDQGPGARSDETIASPLATSYWPLTTPLLSGWHSFSLTPGLSRDATLLFLLYALLFWITLDTVRHRESVHRLLRTLYVAGVGVAALGLLHYLFWNGKFYWLWDIWWVEPEQQVRAPFTNRNHFAGFLALTLGPGMAVLMTLIRNGRTTHYHVTDRVTLSRRIHDFKVLLTAGGLALILAGIALSQSRGGIIVGLTVAVASIAGLCRAGMNRVTGAAAAGLIILASLGLVATFGRQDPFQRTAQMLDGNQSLDDISHARLQLWQADLHAINDFPLFGSGPGSHQYVYPLYLEKAHHFTFTHAENCYVQILVECGLAGVALLLAGLFFLTRWCWRSLQGQEREASRFGPELAVAVSVGLLAALIHAVVDFVWYVPAYAAGVAVLAGLARSLARRKEIAASHDLALENSMIARQERASRMEDGRSRNKNRESRVIETSPFITRPRTSILVVFRIFLGAGLITGSVALAWVVGGRFVQAVPTEYAWNEYYRLLPHGTDERPSENFKTLDERSQWLTEACQHESADPEHYYRLGLAQLELFYQHQKKAAKPAGLLETRRTLRGTHFENPGASRAWLEARYGKDLLLLEKAHAALTKSLDCCPLLGSSYLHLAKVSFLDLSTAPDPGPYFRQAELVRPFDPDVYLQVGLEAWLAGDRAQARESWASACQLDRQCEFRLLPLLASQIPAQEVVHFLPLDFEGLKWLALKEIDLGRTQDSALAAAKAQQAVEQDNTKAINPAFWVMLHELYQQAESQGQAEQCLRKAVRLGPDRLGFHLLLIRWLMNEGQWRAALEQAQDARQQFLSQPDVQALINDILVMKAPGVKVQRPEVSGLKSEVKFQNPKPKLQIRN
jgi:O-antigen ligase